MAICGSCGGDGKCRTCWGAGFTYVRGERVDCNANCGTCGGDGKVAEPGGNGNQYQDPGKGKGGKGGGR